MDTDPQDHGTPLLTEEERAALEELGHVLQRSAGEPFFREGEHTDFVLLIRKGHVKIVAGKPARTIAVRKPGEVVGEMAPIRREPRSASVIAFDEVEALWISAKAWIDFLYAHPRAMHAQLVASEERLDQATRKIVESDLAIEQRLAGAIMELVDEGLGERRDDGVTLRLSQSDLASLIGQSKLDSVKKIMRTFRSAGLVTTARQVVIVRDEAALRKIASGVTTAAP